jgi:hypothetical protein
MVNKAVNKVVNKEDNRVVKEEDSRVDSRAAKEVNKEDKVVSADSVVAEDADASTAAASPHVTLSPKALYEGWERGGVDGEAWG